MNSFAARVREAAAAILPDGAFLKRDRGDALFVTDAPRRRPDADWAERFAAAGFVCEITGGLARLTPGQRWLDALEARCPEPPDMFCASLARFAGREADPAALRLFAAGLRLLDGGRDPHSFIGRIASLVGERIDGMMPSPFSKIETDTE